jgi:superfamily II DNA or RNA helicase
MRPFLAATPARRGTVIGESYSLPLGALSAEDIEEEKKRLTLQARTSFGAPPPPFAAWYVHQERFHVPRFYGLARYGPAETDRRVLGDPIDITFTGTLKDLQVRATVAAQTKGFDVDGGALVSLYCGAGKTVWSVANIARLGRKACILVHKGFLRDQWSEAFARFAPGTRVGIIQGNQWIVEGCDVVIAMVLTLAKRAYDPCLFDCFGTLCADECHHMAAPIMNLATRLFRAKYIIGLTATKERPDGLTPLLHWSLGSEVFHAERDTEKCRVSIALFPQATREIVNREGKPIVSIMISKLTEHERRNAFIAERIIALRKTGRVLIVLSDRLAQLRTLRAHVLAACGEQDVGIFTGTTKESERTEQLAREVLFCSYAMASEGLDKPEADTLVLASPKARVVQCVGRIQRPCATKKSPLVLDVADDLSVFVHLRWKRQRMYAKEGYTTQVLHHDVDASQWFS